MEDIRMRIESLIKKSKDERIRYISLLAEEIMKRRLVVFVGAGCSKSLGLPLWSELIDGLLEKYNIKSKELNIFRLASRLERELGPLKFREKIVESLRINDIGKNDLHDALINLETNLFITTNYDTLLEDYFKTKGISPFIISNPKDIPAIDPTKKTIVKLHGDLNSPTSLVINAADYTKYKSENKAFINWLRSVASQRSIIFVGASFDDPRLKDIDDYVLNIFGSERRQPFIFFKIPEQPQGKSDEDFNIEFDDFEALCDDFRDRGFYLILVEKYEDIAEFLKKVNERALEEYVKEDPENLHAQLKVQNDYSGKLEKSLTNLIDEKIQDLTKKVLGEGRPPGIYKIRKGLKELIEFLNNPPHRLGPESLLHGLLCMMDAFLIIAKTKSDIIKAREYYERANEVFQELKDKSKFQEKLIRLRAKLLFEEGEIDEAINSLAKSKDPKTISFRLLYLTEAKRIDEAYDFIEKNEVNVQWVSEALRIYIKKGKISEAEQLFWKFLEGFEIEKEKGNIEDSDYKGDFFFDSICFVMIYSIYFRALELSGKKDIRTINPFDFSDAARRLLRKSLEFVDLFFKERPSAKFEDDYRVIQILLSEMNTCHILAEFERADAAAKKLTMLDPIERQVVIYIILRGEKFPERNSTLKVILKKLRQYSKDYPDQSWAWLEIAIIEMILEKNENSWNALKRTITLIDEDEKDETLLNAFTVGHELDKLDELFILVKNSFQFNNEEIFFWEGFINWLSGNPKEAFEKISKISELNFSLELRALMSHIKGQWEIENQNWEEARKLLEKSFKVQPNPIILRSLLFVLTKLQDDVEALQVAEKIESLGIEDDQVTLIKAQATRNLRQFERSEKAWLKLKEKYPERPEYAFEHARALYFLDKEKEAIKALTLFIQPGDRFDLNCLRLTLEIYSFLGENEKAFSVLENCWQEIQEQPDLIWKHVDLAFKTDNEKEAQKSLKRMEELKEEGKITDMTFFKSDNLEELIKLIKKSQESVEKVFEQYILGYIPRIKLCEISGNTLYLDWAVRTQPLKGDFFSSKGEAEFTIYSTNGFKLNREGKRIQFVPIEAPREAKEIVIDYHALITIHRLGFMEKLCRRYHKIYYPEELKDLWKMEKTRYTQFQLSKVKVYRKLDERLDKNEIKKAAAPIKDTIIDRNLSLAQIEEVPLIDNYIKKEEIEKYSGIHIIRLPQLVDWIYEKGRISESKWKEIKKYSGGEPWLQTKNWKKTLDNSMRFVVDWIMLEVMEEFDINQKLIDMGVVLLIEEHTSDQIHYKIRYFEFEKDVAMWHKQLIQEISENSKFVKVKPDYNKDEIEMKINESLYMAAAYAPIKYCNEKKLFLLTDDRWTQKISTKHFGTDALLRDLFENEIIDIEEYTSAFLKLCKWRYRFLLPDVRILVFIAEQYRKNLPGKDLESIASYLRKNMEDPGLSLALEPTVTPSPVALKYFLAVIDVWFQFLAEIWQKEDVFEEEKLNDITGWFYRYAMPDYPKVIQGEIRSRMYGKLDSTLSVKLFSIVMNTKNHIRLQRLLSKSFESIFENSERKEAALIDLIKYVKNIEFPTYSEVEAIDSQRVIKNFLLVRILETFFGKDRDELLIEVEKRPKLAAEISNIIHLDYEIDQEEIEYLLKTLANYFQNKEDISEYNRITPLIVTQRTPEKKEYTPLHELIKHPSIEVKKTALKFIAEAEFITELTKIKIEKLKDRLISSPVVYRQEASEEAAKLLLKDFQYTKYFISELIEKQLKEWLVEPLKAILTPNLSTVNLKHSLLIKENLGIKDISLQIREEINSSSGVNAFLDWFLEECFFVPLDYPLNPWEFVKEFISKRKFSYNEALHSIKKWIQDNNDPLAYLMVLEVVLSLRAKIADEEKGDKNEFIGDKFFNFLNHVFEALLMEKSEDVSMDKDLFENIKERWLYRTELSRYYLKYIDLNFNKPADDEYKVVLAWWMARDIEKTFSLLSINEQTLWLKQHVEHIKSERLVNFEHFVRYREKALSIARYYTMVKSSPLTTSALALAVIFSKNGQKCAFKGLKEPTIALNTKFTDAIINSLLQETLWGEEQILTIKKGRLPFLWELPFAISAPAFLRAYYADAFEFLGKDKVKIIKFAEAISNPDFLKDNLPHLPDKLDNENISEVLFLLSSLDSYVKLHGEMPQEGRIFKEHKELLKRIMEIFPIPFNALCIIRGIFILNKMISVGNSEWVEVLRDQLKDIDYDKLAKQLNEMQLDLIQEHILRVVMLGFDLSILNPIVQKKTTSKVIREILGRLKSILESNVTHVPIENRENLRKFLNQIADVPAILEENEK